MRLLPEIQVQHKESIVLYVIIVHIEYNSFRYNFVNYVINHSIPREMKGLFVFHTFPMF